MIVDDLEAKAARAEVSSADFLALGLTLQSPYNPR